MRFGPRGRSLRGNYDNYIIMRTVRRILAFLLLAVLGAGPARAADDARERHARFYLDLAERASPPP